MTLYWWMHWFWITTLKLQVLVSLFPWSLLAHGASLPLAPTVQNGHQNGPYFNELGLSKEHVVTTVPSQLSTNSEQWSHYFVKDLTTGTSKLDITKDLTPPQLAQVEPQVFPPDHDETNSSLDHKSLSEDQKEATIDNVEKQEQNVSYANAAIPSLETSTTISVGKFLFSNTNGNDGTVHTLPHSGPLIVGSRPKGGEDSKIIWIDKLLPKVLGFHDKHTKIEQLDEKVGENNPVDEVPMSDGPYNPTGSFINSTNIRVKAVISTSKTPEVTTGKDPQYLSTNEKTDEETKEKSSNNITSTERTVSFVTDHSENTNNMDHVTENVNGSNNLTINSTESDLEDDNSALITGGNTTYVEKTNNSSIEVQHKNKSHQENIISAVSFDHSNIEESTKVSSGIVQSVIDESVNPRGKSLNAMAITGIVMGAVIGMVLLGAASCMVYRRRYLNNPQTLNDKCSNPDSSGYIDDSTLRENSEEMYSLDNDSFLNSLEAMTIQNYWTDNVKHTKL